MNKHEIDNALRQVAHGDNDAFERLYLETRRGVYAFLFSYFDNRADCEDAMQTVYLKIKTNISQYNDGSNGLAWILQIAKNTALNEIRKKSTSEKSLNDIVIEDKGTDPYNNIVLKNTLMSIMKKELDEEEQRILILHAVWEYKHKEIAKILDCPTGTVTSKYKRAVDKLKRAWKEVEL
ncbi:MAG: RNA polymerase sigma factor [Candidatus Caccovivens sp.]